MRSSKNTPKARRSARAPTSDLRPRSHPDFDDILENFHFSPENAEIYLDGERMVLTDNKSLGIMRRELILALGYERARAVLSRIGYEMGTAYGELAHKLQRGTDVFENFAAGPQIHALKGAVRVEALKFEANPDRGEFYSEYYWHDSAECQAHLQQLGISHEPGGWQQIGHACGYASAFFGMPVIFREIECIAMGHDNCFLIGKPASQWPDADTELQRFRAENYRPPRRTRRAKPGRSEAKRDGTEAKTRRTMQRALVGASAGFNLALHLVDKVAAADTPVLFLGESGVGKEVFARELHLRSARADESLLAVNCAAIPESLIEAELFGVEKGAYTGADRSRAGRFERAAGGTLFLDEVGTLSLAAQGKLLRVLQEGEFERIGGTKVLRSDVRVIAATNADLESEVRDGRFRADLFHRLNTFPIFIPPLRERRADIPVLMDHFVRRIATAHGTEIPGFSNDLTSLFQRYHWPGNVREMENIIERGVILAEAGEPIGISHLLMSADRIRSVDDIQSKDPFRAFVLTQQHSRDATGLGEQLLESGLSKEQIDDALIRAALNRCNGSAAKAAELTGMSRSQVNYWIRKNGR